jgi:hypothetical protein
MSAKEHAAAFVRGVKYDLATGPETVITTRHSRQDAGMAALAVKLRKKGGEATVEQRGDQNVWTLKPPPSKPVRKFLKELKVELERLSSGESKEVEARRGDDLAAAMGKFTERLEGYRVTPSSEGATMLWTITAE